MNDYYEQKIAYEPALDKMRALWPQEADWKNLFDKITQLEPDDDHSGVLGELNEAIALCTERDGHKIVPDPSLNMMSPDNLNAIRAELKLLSNDKLLDMLRTKSIPENIESIFVAGMDNGLLDTDSDDDDDKGDSRSFPPSLELELDLLTKFLGVATGLDDGIFLVRCTVSKLSLLYFLFY